MGAFSGLIGGLTLTSATLYLSLAAHQRNRASQSAAVRQQSLILNSLVDADLAPPEPHPRYVAARSSLTEAWKDRWNTEIENMARWGNDFRWDNVRATVEGSIRQWTEEKKN